MCRNQFQEEYNSNDVDLIQKQRYRVITGAFIDKATADQVVNEIKELYGLVAYVIPEQVKKSNPSL